ncbi:MAG: hypothetical protein JWR07_2488 [Nevskia sp.]|nr:hypothetical protein [Nevskia sp.]
MLAKICVLSCSSIAQSVEQLTVNQRVVGSSPTRGARIFKELRERPPNKAASLVSGGARSGCGPVNCFWAKTTVALGPIGTKGDCNSARIWLVADGSAEAADRTSFLAPVRSRAQSAKTPCGTPFADSLWYVGDITERQLARAPFALIALKDSRASISVANNLAAVIGAGLRRRPSAAVLRDLRLLRNVHAAGRACRRHRQ